MLVYTVLSLMEGGCVTRHKLWSASAPQSPMLLGTFGLVICAHCDGSYLRPTHESWAETSQTAAEPGTTGL